jgi:hypothetical protein
MQRIMRITIITFCLAMTASLSIAATNISARIADGWIVASRGRDENSQVVKVKVWGTTRVTGEFHQLDTDPEKEYVVMSRMKGTGPYYKLQIIDFLPNGILTWSYDSSGVPKIKDGEVSLGYLPKGYQGAATIPVYDKYKLSALGLSKVKENK